MQTRNCLRFAILAVGALVAMPAAAVQVSMSDTCGGVVSAFGASLVSDANGDITINGANGAFTSLFGCDAPLPAVPACVLSASKTSIPPGGSVTLLAKCPSNPAANSYTWFNPLDTPTPASGSSSTITFPTPGAYTYSVKASNGSLGPVSNQVTILVGDSNSKPICTAAASPAVLVQGGTTNMSVTCNPDATTFNWSQDAGAPPVGSNPFQFNSAGTFIYRVQGVNAAGTGPVAAAAVTVTPTPAPLTASMSFSPAFIFVDANSTLTITLANSGPVVITGVAFTNTYPSGLRNAAAPAASTTCGGSVTAAANGTSVSLSGGTIPVAGNCTVTVTTTSATVGNYTNMIAPGAVTSANVGSNPFAATAVLTVSAPPQFTNYGFELPVVSVNSVITFATPSWTCVAGSCYNVTSGYLTAHSTPVPPDGSAQAAMFTTNGDLSTTVTINTPGSYTINLSAAARTNPLTLQVTMDGQQVGANLQLAVGTWGSYSVPITVSAAGNRTFHFVGVNPGISAGYVVIDNVRIVQ